MTEIKNTNPNIEVLLRNHFAQKRKETLLNSMEAPIQLVAGYLYQTMGNDIEFFDMSIEESSAFVNDTVRRIISGSSYKDCKSTLHLLRTYEMENAVGKCIESITRSLTVSFSANGVEIISDRTFFNDVSADFYATHLHGVRHVDTKICKSSC